jgi:hypothetical protein
MTSIASIQQTVVEILEILPPDKQQELLNFAKSLKASNPTSSPQKTLKGMWADLNINITDEDLEEARHEIWANFPRNIEP